MLISYPILPADAGDQSEDDRFTAMLALAQRDRGLYPVTTGNRWHGGIHLTPGLEPIRAIADGVIVAYRLAPDTKDYPGQGAYDTSFVLIRHETDSGENTRVVFYSLYMHLRPKGLLSNAQRQQLASFLRDAPTSDNEVQAPANTRIWRKEVLGFGGQIYGHPTVHFEIFATEADFNVFWRDRAAVAAGHNGSDDVFGDMHLIIPAGRDFVATHPHANADNQIVLATNARGAAIASYPAPAGTAGRGSIPATQVAHRVPVDHTLPGGPPQIIGADGALHVTVRFEQGARIATTYQRTVDGGLTQLGAPVRQDDYEYELYRLATALYPDCPSAGFEYLRFGRILGPDTTARVENWQLIRYSATETGYVNLADPANEISVLSDADFPMHWRTLQEGEAASPADGIANIEELTRLLRLPAEPSVSALSAPTDFATRLGASVSPENIRHLICKHPSEWDASDLEARYQALRQPGKPLHGDTPWKNFKDHVEAMAFWPQSAIAERNVWHFHPLQFIQHYRKCAWLSERELARVYPDTKYPMTALSNEGRGRTPAIVRESYRVEINSVKRKYLITTPVRMTHFYGQGAVESLFLCLMLEGSANYSRNPRHASFQPETDGRYIPASQNDYLFYLENRLGNIEAGDGPKFRGRGMKQLTGRENYSKYWVYRGWLDPATFTSPWWNPSRPDRAPTIHNPEELSVNAYSAIDAGGWYWLAGAASNRFRTINSVITNNAIDRATVRAVARAINGINRQTGDPNGLDERTSESEAIGIVLMDRP